jgi:hypothetical protein
MNLSQNYAGSRQNSSKITKMQMFATQDKVKSCTEGTQGLNVVAVRLTAVQMTKLSL